MFLPHYDTYHVSITEQTMAKCYLFVLYDKNVKNFAKIKPRTDEQVFLDRLYLYDRLYCVTVRKI